MVAVWLHGMHGGESRCSQCRERGKLEATGDDDVHGAEGEAAAI